MYNRFYKILSHSVFIIEGWDLIKKEGETNLPPSTKGWVLPQVKLGVV